jgi:hypothetical protein
MPAAGGLLFKLKEGHLHLRYGKRNVYHTHLGMKWLVNICCVTYSFSFVTLFSEFIKI